MPLLDLDVGVEHAGNHYPGHGDDESWQESFALAWYDPVADISGWHHTSIKRPLGVIDLKSWVCVRGVMRHSLQTWTMPIPDQDHTDLTLGPIRLTSALPFQRERFELREPGVEIDIESRPLVGPHWYNRKAMELAPSGKSHWESYNGFQGSVRVDGEETRVSGYAFLSRSWGPRNLDTILGFRILWASFGEALNLRVLAPITATSRKPYGFAVEGGVLHPLRDIRVEAVMAMDGANPLGCSVTAWGDRGGYRLTGRVGSGHAQTNTHPGGHMFSHGSCVFEWGGRLGSGFFQVNELKKPAPWDVTRLGL